MGVIAIKYELIVFYYVIKVNTIYARTLLYMLVDERKYNYGNKIKGNRNREF